MAGWLRGKVKEVVSGDTVVIVGGTQGLAVPQEKRLTLSSLLAPRLVSGSCIGKLVVLLGAFLTQPLVLVGQKRWLYT